MSKRKVANTPNDPTAPGVPITLAGKTYHLCLDLAALAEAETHFTRQGHDCNLLLALPTLNVNTVMTVFPCAVHKHHPELTFQEARKLVNLETLYTIANAIAQAWTAAMPDPEEKKENP